MDMKQATAYVFLASAWVTLLIVAAFAFAILRDVLTHEIDLTRLLSEPTGDASMSRFQLLIFTFVVALSLFLIVVSQATPQLPDVPGGVLTLLGISASSYVVSKSIQFSKPEGVEDRPPHVAVTPSNTSVTPGQQVPFSAEVQRTSNTEVTWAIVAPASGTINSKTGLYTAPAKVPPGGVIDTIQAQSVANPLGVGSAIVKIAPANAVAAGD